MNQQEEQKSEAMKIAEEIFFSPATNGQANDSIMNGVKLIEAYGNQRFIEGQSNKWVSVETPPEESFYYQTWAHGFSRPIELYYDIQDGNFRTQDRSIISVTKWQPLPPPPTT